MSLRISTDLGRNCKAPSFGAKIKLPNKDIFSRLSIWNVSKEKYNKVYNTLAEKARKEVEGTHNPARPVREADVYKSIFKQRAAVLSGISLAAGAVVGSIVKCFSISN